MPLHPQCRALIDAAANAGAPFDAGDYRAIRAGYARTTPAYLHPTPALDSIVNLVFDGPAGSVPLRLYRPFRTSATAAPALVYFHGGGWVVGDLDSHDHLCRHLAGKSRAVVIAVDYRLAPEHKFPAAVEDTQAAVRWVAAHAGELRLDAERLAVGGDSAGGNLAAVAALALRDAGGPPLRLQLLIYPALDFTADNASLRENATGYLLSTAAMEQFADWYLPDRASRGDPRASPQRAADHRKLPPACILTAEFDPLRDEALAYVETLRKAGVAVEHHAYPGMIHGFARMGGRIDMALTALDDAALAVHRALGD